MAELLVRRGRRLEMLGKSRWVWPGYVPLNRLPVSLRQDDDYPKYTAKLTKEKCKSRLKCVATPLEIHMHYSQRVESHACPREHSSMYLINNYGNKEKLCH